MKYEYRMILTYTAVANLPEQAKHNTLIGSQVEIRNGCLLNAILERYHYTKLLSIYFF